MERKSVVFGERESNWWNSLPSQTKSKHIRNAIGLYVEVTGINAGEYKGGEIQEVPELDEVLKRVEGTKPKVDFEVKKKSTDGFNPLDNLIQG